MDAVPAREVGRSLLYSETKLSESGKRSLAQPVIVSRNGRDRMIFAEEYARLKRCDPQLFSTADMHEELVGAVRKSKMDPRHNHLDGLSKTGCRALT